MSVAKTKREPTVDECIHKLIRKIENDFITSDLEPKFRRAYLAARRRLYESMGEVPPRFKAAKEKKS
jgi:hypothetical protein